MDERFEGQDVCEAIPQPAILVRADLSVAHLNQAAASLLGLPLPAGDVAWSDIAVDPVQPAPGVVTAGTWQLRTRRGEAPHRIRFSPLPGADQGWLALVEPDDAMLLAEEGAPDLFRRIVDAAQDMVFIIGRDDRVEYVNDYGARALGSTPAQLIGQPRTALFPAEVAARQNESIREVFATGRTISRESRTRMGQRDVWLDTRLVPLLDASGEVASVLGVSRDASAKRQAAEALRNSHDTAWALLNASGDIALLVDTNWRVVAANGACARTFGKRIEDLVGSDIFGHMDPGVAEDRRRRGDLVISTREPLRFQDSRGQRHFVNSIYPVMNHNREVIQLAVYVDDITQLKQAEERQRLMATGLRSLISIADDLLRCEDMDSLLRLAVELPRERFELERCSVFLAEDDRLRGTYGTSLGGSTNDERELTLPVDPRLDSLSARTPEQPRWAASQGTLREWDGRELREVGPGWHARTQIRSADKIVGIFFNDNALRGKALDPTTQELVAVYCSLLGNILERKRAEGDLRQSEERLREMTELMPAVFWVTSLDGRRLHYVSPAFERIAGRSGAELIDRDGAWMELVHPEDRAAVEEMLQTSSADELDVVYRIVRPDGQVRTVNTKTIAVHQGPDSEKRVFGFTLDITEREEAQSALRDSEQRFRTLFEAANDGLLAVDINTLGILTANRGMTEMLGYSLDELLALSVTDIHPPEATPDIHTRFSSMVKGELSMVKDVPVLHRDGTVFYADISASPLTLDGRQALLGVFHDVTERRRTEDSQRLAAIGQLAAGVAHEFNNLLASMMLAAELAADRSDDQGFRRLTEVVLDSTARGAEICHNLVTFARPREPMRIPVSIEQTIDAALAVASRQLELSEVSVARQYESGGALVLADPGQLEQVFLNLIINACHAMPLGGTITVRTACDTSAPGCSVVLAEVSDTGTGIKPHHLPHVFEPFFTTKGVRGDSRLPGSGLGLSVSLGIMQGHGGSLEARSVWGAGSTLTLRMPACGETDAEARQPRQPAQRASGSVPGLRVLVAEDEPGLRELITDVLTQRGHVVVTVASGDAAAEALRHHEFDALVTDLVMPGGGGLLALNSLRDLSPRPVSLVVTGRIEPEEVIGGDLADACITKPFSLADLVSRLEGLVEARRTGESGA